jgi:cell division initiation protein
MKLSPLDIRHKEFHRGMRGYADAEVDEFLDSVADEFERVVKENAELSDRLEAIQEQLGHYRGIEDTLQKTLLSAQQNADEVRAGAQKEAQLVLRDAEVKARDALNDAYGAKQEVEREIVLLRNAEAEFRFKFRALLEGYLKQLAGDEAGARERAGEFERQAQALRDAIAAQGKSGSSDETPPDAAPARAPAQGAAPAPQQARTQESPPTPSPAPPQQKQETTPKPAPAEVQQPTPVPPPEDESADTAVIPAPPEVEVRRPLEEEADDFFADVDEQVGGGEFKW